MIHHRRILASLAVAGLAAWALWLAPLERPRVVLESADGASLWFSPDSKLVAASDWDGVDRPALRVYRVADGSQVSELKEGGGHILSMAFLDDGSKVAGVLDPSGSVLVWDVLSGEVTERIPERFTEEEVALKPLSLRFADDGELLMLDFAALSRSPPTLRWQSVKTGKSRVEKLLPAFDASPEGRWKVAQGECHARLVYLDDEQLRTLDALTGECEIERRAPAGKSVADGGPELMVYVGLPELKCWLCRPPFEECERASALDGSKDLWISPNGGWIVGCVMPLANYAWYARWLPAPETELQAVNVNRPSEVWTFRHGDRVRFSPDGKTLAVFTSAAHPHETVWSPVELWDFPPRRAWGKIICGTLAAGVTSYLLLCWRARRRMKRPGAAA